MANFGKVREVVRPPDSNGKVASWKSRQRLSVNDATTRVLHEIAMLRVAEDDLVVSTNVRLRLDGLPVSGDKEPEDPGAAVYWRKHTQTKCMAIDQYTKVADNLAAIAATLEAMRAIGRYSNAEVLERAFLGFQALPPPGESWREVLQFAPTENTITPELLRVRYLAKARAAHPDAGGTAEKFKKVREAYDDARTELRFGV